MMIETGATVTHATIFDCDGTLVDSETLANEVLVEMLAERGLAMTIDEAVTTFRGMRMQRCIDVLEARFDVRLPDDLVAQFRRRMEDAFRDRLRPVEGAVDVVRAMDGPIAVASNGPRQKIELSLSLTGLLPYFDGRIFSSYDVGSWKPDPGLFLHAASALGVPPGRCTVVEDSLHGVRAGLAAGMRVVAFQPHGRDADLPPGVRVIERLADLSEALVPARCRPMWDAFVETVGDGAEARFGEAFHFCHTAELADPLAQLVVDGVKRATAGLLWSYEAHGLPLPEVGQYFVVTNFDGTPRCVIETTTVRVLPFEDVDEAFALREGEGDKSLRYWRDAHWAFFTRECESLGRGPEMSMPVVCEEFDVVFE